MKLKSLPLRRSTLLGALLLLSLAPSSAGGQVVPELPFVKERLANGLVVIYHQDRRLPLCTVNTWYHVGSKDEAAGRSGFAHLFEHLMFMGTEKVPGGQFDTIMEGAGGSNNASTSSDRTNYYDTGPSHLLPILLYLEADRMEGFGRAINQEKLDTQRRVVQNERRQSYENRPYGKAMLLRDPLLYPPGHPYHEPVIGSHEDLERATVGDVKEFFARYYVPANASLVVAGDFDLEPTRKLVHELYEKIPAGKPAEEKSKAAGLRPQRDQITIEDKVQLARVVFYYHSPAIFDEGDADLDIVGHVLGDGKSSRLYRSLVYEKKLAQDVDAAQSSELLGSVFEIQATVRPGQSLEAVERAIDEVIEGLKQNPPSANELDRARNGYESAFWHRVEGLGARADLLNNYQFHFGDPGGIERDLGRYRKVTPASAVDWARKVLRSDSRLAMRVVPEGTGTAGAAAEKQPLPAAPAKASASKPPAPAGAAASGADVGAGESKPPATASAAAKLPEPLARRDFLPEVPAVLSLSSGIPLWVLPSKQVPLVSVVLLVRGAGAASDPEGKQGLASLTASLLDEGAGKRGALELSDDLDLLGATLTPSGSRERGELRLSVLRKNLDPALDLFADVLLRPQFSEKEWERVKALTLNDLKQRRASPAAVARLVLERSSFGEGHPYAAPIAGYSETVAAISLEEAKGFYRDRWRPEEAAIVVAGDIAPEEVRAKLEARLAGWKPAGGPTPTPAVPSLPPAPRPRLLVVEKAGAPQTVIAISMPGISRVDPTYADLTLANLIFGGSFTSRLNLNLREEHEFTYGISSNFHRLRGPGLFTLQTSVKTDTTGAALAEIARECRGMAAGLREGELEKARAGAQSHAVESFSTVSGSAEMLVASLDLGLPPTEPRRILERVAKLTADEVAKAARAIIRWDAATIVLVGDREALAAELKKANEILGRESPGAPPALPAPIQIDADGKPLARG